MDTERFVETARGPFRMFLDRGDPIERAVGSIAEAGETRLSSA